MVIDNFAQNMLRELSEGKEINWDCMPDMVKDGKVRREDAVASLRQGLVGGILSKYREFARKCYRVYSLPEQREFTRTYYGGYWGQRLAEAESALKAIEEGGMVEYRGVRL